MRNIPRGADKIYFYFTKAQPDPGLMFFLSETGSAEIGVRSSAAFPVSGKRFLPLANRLCNKLYMYLRHNSCKSALRSVRNVVMKITSRFRRISIIDSHGTHIETTVR